MIKALFNCSTNIVGGGLKNSAWFIKNALTDSRISWTFAVSPQVCEILLRWNIDVNQNNFFIFYDSPSKNFSSRRELFDLSQQNNFNFIYTMAGPSYVSFKTLHFLGISDPYVIYGSFPIIKYGRSFSEAIMVVFQTFYKLFKSRDSDYWVFQTFDSLDSFCRRTFVKKSKCFVVYNSIGDNFLNINHHIIASKNNSSLTIFCPAANYPHKALNTIPYISWRLKQALGNIPFKFVLTIPIDSSQWSSIYSLSSSLGVLENVGTMGPFNHSEVYEVHKNVDIVYIPSLLEVFSSSYLEAIALGLPLVVSDFSFSRQICGDYAYYVNPFDYNQIVNILLGIYKKDFIIENEKLKHKESILTMFGSQKNRYESLVHLFLNNFKTKTRS
jgi:glycosyltransferase involved in cell wall biosynthesis